MDTPPITIKDKRDALIYYSEVIIAKVGYRAVSVHEIYLVYCSIVEPVEP